MIERGLDDQQGAFDVYELLLGESLRAIVHRASLDIEAWVDFVRQSMTAVAGLHAVRWVHGDLNDGNFLLERSGRWKLLELPFHRLAPPRSPLFGSIYTLAPEQIEGHDPDTRSDLYSLGCLYYYAASGKYPHTGANDAEIAIGRLRFAPTPLQELAPTLPRPLAEWTHDLLAREPAKRPDAASALRLLPA